MHPDSELPQPPSLNGRKMLNGLQMVVKMFPDQRMVVLEEAPGALSLHPVTIGIPWVLWLNVAKELMTHDVNMELQELGLNFVTGDGNAPTPAPPRLVAP